MAPKCKMLDENGLQLCNIAINGKQKMKPDDCLRGLTQISCAWDPYVTSVIMEHDGERCCVLKCKGTGCSAELSCTNPSAQVAAHRAICKGSQPRRSPRQHGTNASRCQMKQRAQRSPPEGSSPGRCKSYLGSRTLRTSPSSPAEAVL